MFFLNDLQTISSKSGFGSGEAILQKIMDSQNLCEDSHSPSSEFPSDMAPPTRSVEFARQGGLGQAAKLPDEL